MKTDHIYYGDCLEIMPTFPDKCFDMILCDLPYGITACKWDNRIPLDLLWLQYKRIIKDHGAIVLIGSQPFTSLLIVSNLEMFRYEIIWDKIIGGNFINAKRMPLKAHENVLVFYKKLPTYNPQMTLRDCRNYRKRSGEIRSEITGFIGQRKSTNSEFKYPISLISINRLAKEMNSYSILHPAQKPIALFEYLVKTYTNEGDLVLDNCIGSGTTAIACIRTNRHFVGIEKEAKYVVISRLRIAQEKGEK